MAEDSSRRTGRGFALDRRTVLSGLTGVTLGTTLFAGGGAAESTDENTNITENTEPSRYTPRPDGTADGGTQSLNGTWEFALANSDTIVDEATVTWQDETVPGQWEYDHYYVPDGAADWYPPDGERGWYRREFDVPNSWDDGRLLLRFDAVYSEAVVFLNGVEVAQHTGGYTPFEVDITDAVDPESNTLAVGVSQRSKADDIGWQNVTGGITRDVTLVSVPETHLSECIVRTALESDSEATVSIGAVATNAGGIDAETADVMVTLRDPDGATVGSTHADLGTVSAGETERTTLDIDVTNPKPWNPEQPRLYTAIVELTVDGTTEHVTERVGIREVSVEGNDLLINGQSVLLRGIDWEEIHLPKYGQAVPSSITREDVKRLTEANINYVRTAHFPVSEAFIEACDEFGVIVEEEAPHMFVGRDRGDPDPELVVQQTLEMVERDRNRPSVCIWSVANESEWYECFATAAEQARARDPTRPMIFDHDVYNESDPWHDEFELRAHHYPAFRSGSTVEQYADLDAPLLFNEYGHLYCYNDQELVTDPGLRDQWGLLLETVWDQFRAADSVAGGAIWAGSDHLERWGPYLWGALDRNRRRRPEFWHIRKVYAPVQFSDVEWHAQGHRVSLTVENRHEFIDLAECTLTVDNDAHQREHSIDLPPGEEKRLTFTVPHGRFEITAVHPSGHTINELVATPDTPSKHRSKSTHHPPKTVATAPLSVHADTDTGSITIEGPDGTTLVNGLELALTPIQGSAGREYATGIDHRPSGRTVTDIRTGDSTVVIDVEYDTAKGTFTLDTSKEGVDVKYQFTLTDAVATREVGVAFPTIGDLTTLSWTRDGQWSVYPDDHVGRLSGTASAFPDGTRPSNEGISIQSGQPWKDDTTMHGSNDFRSTKRNVYSAALSDRNATGISTRAMGDQHVRAQVRSDSVDLLVLDRSISGTNAYEWMDRHPVMDEQPTLDAGTTLEGSVRIGSIVSDSSHDGNDHRGHEHGHGNHDDGHGHGRKDHDNGRGHHGKDSDHGKHRGNGVNHR